MEYRVIYLNDYNSNKQLYLNLINKMFQEDDSKIANLDEISNHLDYIFNADYNLKSFLVLQIINNNSVK